MLSSHVQAGGTNSSEDAERVYQLALTADVAPIPIDGFEVGFASAKLAQAQQLSVSLHPSFMALEKFKVTYSCLKNAFDCLQLSVCLHRC